MASPTEQFDRLQKNSEFIFVVFYRGHWCPFCIEWIKNFSTITASIKAAGGTPIIVTAESDTKNLSIVRDNTGYKDTAIIDPTNSIAAELKSKGLLEVAISSKGGYEHGMAQPAVLVLEKGGRVRYGWAIKPALMNLGGAKDRPSLVQIWQDVEAEMQGKASVHGGSYSKQTFFQGISTQLFG